MKNYDVIVVGAGHAGLEAAFAAANKKYKVGLFTLVEDSVGQAPCNPSIGGPAKGIVTREIDALGGMQGIVTDHCALQMKLLNSSKGPGVWAYRAQIDKEVYHQYFLEEIKKHKYIDLNCIEVNELVVENNTVKGINTPKGIFKAKAVILTTGTYMNSITHMGKVKKASGPLGFPRSNNLSNNLKDLGFSLLRLKTGTPPRVDKDSIDFNKMEIQKGTNAKLHFNFYGKQFRPYSKQIPCYLTYTNAKTHKIILDNLSLSAMYSGQISGVGPRYCPSIEDKLVRFKDKPRHQTFIEPVSLNSNFYYLQGLSTSLPKEVQEQFVHTIVGLENCKIIQYAYAIEYDAIDPTQLWPTLESKLIKNLYFAGQINGTSGYEEAAGQGIIAGINATLNIENKKQIILSRSDAYIGVMIDDLVTKGVKDPYRLLTSRAEHRLYLRNDNADDRLLKIGYQVGLNSKARYNKYIKISETIKQAIAYLKTTSLKKIRGLSAKYHSHNLYDLLKQPQIKIDDVLTNSIYAKLDDEVKMKIEIQVKYYGYIKNEEKTLAKFNKQMLLKIDHINDYNKIKNLPLEAREKLNKIKPLTLQQASRIPGISINDLMIIKYYVETNRK